jgi:putative membrane protein
VEEATLDSLAEIELGRIALTKSSDPEIRHFAQRMVTDHSKAREEIASLARAKGLDIPADLDAEHRTIIANIAREEDAAFDRAYCEHMVMKHTKAMALFESATKASDADLAAFAKQKLPTLEQHKELATKLPD